MQSALISQNKVYLFTSSIFEVNAVQRAVPVQLYKWLRGKPQTKIEV